MAKRSRRTRRSRSTQPAAAPEVTPAGQESQPAPPLDRQLAKAIEFTQDYYYVYNDLRWLGVIMILMVALMIGLSFLI